VSWILEKNDRAAVRAVGTINIIIYYFIYYL